MKLYLLAALACSFSLMSMVIPQGCVGSISANKVILLKDRNGFYVDEGTKKVRVKKHWTDHQLINMENDNLKKFLRTHYLIVKKHVNNDYQIRVMPRDI